VILPLKGKATDTRLEVERVPGIPRTIVVGANAAVDIFVSYICSRY
jgi:hypothetical protein